MIIGNTPKILGLGVAIALSLSLPSPSMSAGIDELKLYEIEEGRITYTMSGFQTGTETLIWKDHGRRTKRDTISKINFMGVKQENKQTTFTEGTWIYNFNPLTASATKMENPVFKMFLEGGQTDMVKTGEDMMRAMGGKIVGKDTILGKPCVKWLIQQMMTTCVWKGIAPMSRKPVRWPVCHH